MKTVEQTLLERRSIRRYEREAISQESLNFIYEAIRNTSTSYNGQQFSGRERAVVCADRTKANQNMQSLFYLLCRLPQNQIVGSRKGHFFSCFPKYDGRHNGRRD